MSTEYNRSLDGVRAAASFGVMATHVAFQTHVDPATHIGAILARFDFFVALFFALSGFLLWRGIERYRGRWGDYYLNRFARIMPAYWVLVLAVFVLLPEATGLSTSQIIANLTLTQIYFVDGLAPGLTHLWSLCVEVAFYLVLPPLAIITRLPKTWRVTIILALAVISLGWAYLPFVDAWEINAQIWPPAYFSWFAVGLIAAEYEGVRISWLRHRWVFWAGAIAVAWMAGQEWFGPLGLTHPSADEFALRVIAGTLFAALIVVPYALCPGDRIMDSAPMQFLGRISYSVFLWHLAILHVVFPLTGIGVFTGGFIPVYVLTALLTTVVSAASFEFVEEPSRRALRGVKSSRHARARAHTAASSG